MNIWKLSLRYLQGHKVKTLTLFAVFVTMGACLISLMGIRHSLQEKIISKQERMIYLTSKAEAVWPKEAYQALTNSKIIKKVEASNTAQVSSNLKLPESAQQLSEDKKELTLLGFKETANLTAFEDKQLLLKEGKHLSENDRKKVLVSAALAQKNGLKVGQMVTLAKQELTIAGIFEASKAGRTAFANKNLDNTILANEDLVASLSGKEGYQSLALALADAKQVSAVINSIKQWPLNWEHLTVQNAKEYYGDAYQNVITLYALVNRILTMLSIFATLVLVMMLTFWINNRIKETGILLSIGMSKTQVIAHYLIEVLLVAGVAFVFSVVVGGFMGQGLGESLLSQVNGGLAARTLQDSNLIASKIDALQVTIGWQDVLSLYLQGALISLIAVVASSYSIARLHPKQILSKMS